RAMSAAQPCVFAQPGLIALWGCSGLQVSLARNEKGVLADGRCCRGGQEPPCPVAEPCHTFFRVCLKEYQLRAQPGGPCVLGAASTPVLGGNVFSADSSPRISRDLSLQSDLSPKEPGEIRRTEAMPLHSCQLARFGGFTASLVTALLECRLRVRCHEHYYGPSCNLLCRPRDDFFGHHSCDAAGNKVCLDGWTGNKCQRAVCRQGCHKTHGFCEEPGECRCHYGWTGPHCDQCLLFPGCVHGSCTVPWKCDCETNWGGLLCDKDLNYCGSHRPCQNGGTCANKEPDEYECLCPEGFGGRNCEDGEPPCPSELCANGGSCHPTPSGPQCVCPPGWRGKACQDGMWFPARGRVAFWRRIRQLEGKRSAISALGSNFTSTNSYADRQSCSCQPGYTGAECETEQRSCRDAPCLHGGQCQQAENQTSFCRCPLGFSGRWCEKSFNGSYESPVKRLLQTN
uniref:Delta-like protein n=1 Tax=Pseudonaja textilis TaxID=8673 RepID=A0A670ZMI1_PSETE